MQSKIFLFLSFISLFVSNIFAQQSSEQKDDDVAIVYYVKEITTENVLKLYKLLGVDLQGKTGVKIHFGEEGNKNFLNPELTRLLMQETKATWVETNVLYVSKRRFTDKHIALAKQHGFTFAPIDILDKDGEIDVSTEGMGLKHYKNVKLGKGFMDYDNYIIYSHFKGHGSAGFGGAIKNIAMGFASPGGKMAQHASDIPQINNPSECVSCANCVRNCPASAISLDGQVHIDTTKCIGCAKCIAECPLKLFSPKKVQLTGDIFLERLVEYAKVATSLKPMVFINVLANISSVCDCSSKAPAPFTQDIGILASRDIVAIDQASLDLVAKGHQCDDPFLKESGKSGKAQLEYAEKLKMGKRKYILVEVK
ncbi:MAG: DUF362 domain-containing protein [Bacteroidales bacterium]|nr:DUF362 domain-containing protein [Bacteroidales bacterium]